ncbi:putative polysaccharide pyruvyl transferase [Nostoc linckia NIES-25]|nr:putative polysaccharide pyruvyl transferase [Nostoc linckia NIES-25]
MKAVITGVTGLRNRGVEALLTTTVEQLLKRCPDLSIDILTETPDYDQLRLPQNNINLISANGDYKGWIQKLRNKSSKFYKPVSPEYAIFQGASVVIASGGDLFTSDYGGLRLHLKPLELALHAGVPVVFLAQSIGPFKTDEEADAWLQVARYSKLITVREQLSYKYITKDLGLSTDLVKHTADSAFLLNPPPSEDVANMLKSYGVTQDRPVVAIAPSQLISRYVEGDRKRHLQAWCQIIKLILDEFNAQVLIIPHVHDNRPSNDDRLLGTDLLKAFKFDPRIHFAGAENSASEFKGLISACDLVIAERMHASIAGLSSAVCTVVVGYSVKAEGIISDLFGTESLNNGLLISIQDFLDADVACAAVRTAWIQRHQISNQVKEVLPTVKKNAENNFELISHILASLRID